MVKEIDFDSIHSMSEEQQQQAYYTLSKRANQRFRDMEKKEIHSHAVDKAKAYLEDVYSRSTFKQSKKLSGQELKEGLQALEDFYTSKTATIKGVHELEEKHLKLFAEKGIIIDHKEDRKKFFQFLASSEFKELSKYADSKQVADDFSKAIDEGFTVNQIMEGYNEFLENDMTFEEVEERREKIIGVMLH